MNTLPSCHFALNSAQLKLKVTLTNFSPQLLQFYQHLKCILLSTLWQLYLYHQKYFHFRHKIVWKWHCLICWLVQTSAVCSKTKDGFSLKNVIFFLKRLWPIYTDQWKVHSLVVWTSMMFEFVCACVWPSVFGCTCNEPYKWDKFSHWCYT